jgi:hypothetical protein
VHEDESAILELLDLLELLEVLDPGCPNRVRSVFARAL